MTRHVRSAAGVKVWHEPIGSPIVSKKHVPKAKSKKPVADTSVLQTNFGDASDVQVKAFNKAELFYEKNHHNDFADPFGEEETTSQQREVQFWMDYMDPAHYQEINDSLRNKQDPHNEELAHRLFLDAAIPAPKPIKTYRGLKTWPGGIDWAEQLKPGSTFKDNGMISTTPDLKVAQAWVTLSSQGDYNGKANPKSVVMEIRAPKGAKVLGGAPSLKELMLEPGSQFKIISNESVTATQAYDPLEDRTVPPFKYTHVVAELVTS